MKTSTPPSMSLREDRKDMGEVAAWLIASRVSASFVEWLKLEFGGVQAVGPGLMRANCHGSAFLVVDLHSLPLTVETLPLMMAYKGSRENEVAEMALRYGRQYPMFLEQAAVYHARAMGDVMTMHGFGPEVYRPLVDMKALVHFLGEHALIEEIGTERIIQEIGEERFIQEIGKERLLQDLLAKLGPEKSREILERATRTQADEKG